MVKRLQVILQDSDYEEIQRMVRSRHLSLASWRREALADIGRKLAVIRAAARHDYPVSDIGRVL